MLNGGMLLFAINQYVVATIMPSVVADLGGVGFLTWSFSLFAVGAIIGAAGAGPSRERWGTKRAYAGAGLVLGIGLLGSAFASDMLTLVSWRFVQGIGGGAVAAQSYGLVAVMFPESLRGRVLGTVSTTWGIATLGGPAFGAAFSDAGLWRWAFGLLVPLTVVFALVAWRYVPGQPPDASRRSAMPWWRLALFGIAVLCFSATSLTSNIWNQAALAVIAIAMATAAFVRDARAEQRIFPRDVTVITSELGALCWIFFLVSIMVAFVGTYTTFYLQELHDVAPLSAGYLFAIVSFTWTGGALLVAQQPIARATTLIIGGLVLMVAASAAIAATLDPGPLWAIALALSSMGFGIGFLNNPAIQKVIVAAPEGEQQRAGTSVQAIRNIGMSFGAAIAGTIAASAGLEDGTGRDVVATAMQWVYAAGTLAGIVALVIALLVLRPRS